VFVKKMFFLRRMCIPNTNESALIYMVLPARLVIHRRFCIFLFSFFNKKTRFFFLTCPHNGRGRGDSIL
jgi:hypothetical protein